MGSTETTEGGQRRRCRQCCEWMGVRARICPHCRTRTLKADLRGELIRLGLVLGLALTSALWFKPFISVCGWAGQLYVHRVLAPALVRSLQPIALHPAAASTRPQTTGQHSPVPSGTHAPGRTPRQPR